MPLSCLSISRLNTSSYSLHDMPSSRTQGKLRLLLLVAIACYLTVDVVLKNSGARESTRALPKGIRECNLQPRISEPRERWKTRLEGPLEPEDPKVLQWIRDEHLHAPSYLAYELDVGDNIQYTKLPYWQRVHDGIMALVKEKRNGFFLEAGALDGYYQSNTFFLERDHNWTGLLVEPNPVFFESLLARHRKAWATDLCLGTKPYPFKTEFWVHTGSDPEQALIAASRSGLLKEHLRYYEKGGLDSGTVVEVNCVPVISILSALNVTQIDLFSLDIENAEVSVLEWFPFDRIHIEILVVEHWSSSAEDTQWFVRFVENKGFSYYRRDNHDYFFIHQRPRWVRSRPGDAGAIDNLKPYESIVSGI